MRPSLALTVMTVVIMAVGVAIPPSPLGHYLGFSMLPRLYWPLLGLTIVCYMLLHPGCEDVAAAS